MPKLMTKSQRRIGFKPHPSIGNVEKIRLLLILISYRQPSRPAQQSANLIAKVFESHPPEVSAVYHVIGAHEGAELLGGSARGPVVIKNQRVAQVLRSATNQL